METEEMVKLAKRGNDEAFYQLMQWNKEKLYRIAYTYLKNEADSIEAIQEVTYRAYTKLNKLKEPKFFHTWLVRILINYCMDEQKRKKRVIPDLIQVEELRDSEEDHVNRMDIEKVLDHLEPKYKNIIILKYFEDMTITEIAKILELPVGTVKTWLNRALHNMRANMVKEGEGNRV